MHYDTIGSANAEIYRLNRIVEKAFAALAEKDAFLDRHEWLNGPVLGWVCNFCGSQRAMGHREEVCPQFKARRAGHES